MRNAILLSLLCLLLLSSCGSAPADTPPAPAETGAATVAEATATVAAEPTVEPSPTAAPQPYSGPNPRLAILEAEGERLVIQVIELGSEEAIASIPVEDSWKMALSPDGRKLFNFALTGEGAIYDLESGESRSIELGEFAQEDNYLHQVVWSPSQQWLSFHVRYNNGRQSLWVYGLETGQLQYVDDIANALNWASREDLVSYTLQSQNFPRFTYNLATGEKTAWGRNPSFEIASAQLSHDGLVPDGFGCTICVYPDLGLVRDYLSFNESPVRYDYHFFDLQAMELLTHVASFRTGRELLDYRMEVVKALPIWERGDYLLFVQENNDLTGGDVPVHYYAAWSQSGEMPFTVVDGELSNVLPDVMPVAVSPDGRSFVGLRLLSVDAYYFVLGSAVVVDITTAEILYEYPVSTELTYFNPPTQANGLDIVWSGE